MTNAKSEHEPLVQALKLLDEDEGSILILLGRSLSQDTVRFGHKPEDQFFLELARTWLRENSKEIRRHVCENPNIVRLLRSDNYEKAELVAGDRLHCASSRRPHLGVYYCADFETRNRCFLPVDLLNK
jgi:hypothetical protein